MSLAPSPVSLSVRPSVRPSSVLSVIVSDFHSVSVSALTKRQYNIAVADMAADMEVDKVADKVA